MASGRENFERKGAIRKRCVAMPVMRSGLLSDTFESTRMWGKDIQRKQGRRILEAALA